MEENENGREIKDHISKISYRRYPEAESYGTGELDTKLLYVAMTRPLHRLYIYHRGNPSKLLERL